ncbi:hypothetical protein QBC45DRAFT_397755 [Copromyces sp. CBS 386.78]|nr:hypothetical protein QBC45DRAFT_397755 [Copromyces sp. CBS 386.78]
MTPSITGSVASQLLRPGWMATGTANIGTPSFPGGDHHQIYVQNQQAGASRCFRHLRNRPNRATIALITTRISQGIWSCSNCFKRVAANNTPKSLCEHCLGRKRQDRGNRRNATGSTMVIYTAASRRKTRQRRMTPNTQDDEESENDDSEMDLELLLDDFPITGFSFGKDMDPPNGDGGAGGFGAPESVSPLVF